MKHQKMVTAVIVALLIAVGIELSIHYYEMNNKEPLIAYVADAYVEEANYFLDGYHNFSRYPVSPAIGGGSYTDANKIGSGDPADVFISVALSPYGQNYLKSRYSGWAVAFASDQLVLAYYNSTEDYRIASELRMAEQTNNSTMFVYALDAITNRSSSLGISDPSTDPAGLRAWISLEIAGKEYRNNEYYFVDSVRFHRANVTRSSAAQLVPALETGEISFLFIYRSAAVHSGLEFVQLPESMNFGNPAMSAFYASFMYRTVAGIERGSPILLYITALANNTLQSESLAFVNYTLNNRASVRSFGMSVLAQPELFNNTPPPPLILTLLSDRKIVRSGGID